MPQPLVLVSIGLKLIRGTLIMECLILIFMAVKLLGTHQRLLVKGVFVLGLFTFVACGIGFAYLRTEGLSASWPVESFGPDPITQTLCLLAIETGVLGYFSFDSVWRISPLALVLAGTLVLVQPALKLF